MADDSWVDLDDGRSRGGVSREPPPRGTRSLTAILPSGRVVWLNAAQPWASAASVAQLAQSVDSAAEWRQSATHAQSRAIEQLQRSVGVDAERLGRAAVDRADAVRRRLVTRYNRLDQKISKAAAQLRSRVDAELKLEEETLRRLRWRDLWDKILVATSLPLFAAYGEPGQPFGANNIALTLSLLVWLVGDEIVDAIFGSEDASPYLVGDNDAWSYLAPVGNLLTGWWLMSDNQHQRFVAGMATIRIEDSAPTLSAGKLFYRHSAEIDLSPQIAANLLPDFQTFIGVPVVATIGSVRLSADGQNAHALVRGPSARVEAGRLRLSFVAEADPPAMGHPVPPVLGDLDVAWIVDTKQPPETASPS